MTSGTTHSEPFADPCALEASSRPSSPEAPAPGTLLRALLAGAVALLVLLLPAELAASRGGDDGRAGCRDEGCAIGAGAALGEPSWWDRTSAREIRGHVTC